MGTKYSDSHVENIERFRNIIQQCSAFGVVYNPSNPKLSLANMTLLLNEAEQLNTVYTKAFIAAKRPINERQELIEELVKRMRRVKNLVFCSGASESMMRDVEAMVDKFSGDKVRKKKTKDGKPAEKWVSNSHLGVDSRQETLGLLLEVLRNEPHYTPNEPILQMAALDDAAERLESLTRAVSGANANAAIKRIERDNALYLEGDGLVDVSLMCKKYVRALFGARSEEAKVVSAIKLKRFIRIAQV